MYTYECIKHLVSDVIFMRYLNAHFGRKEQIKPSVCACIQYFFFIKEFFFFALKIQIEIILKHVYMHHTQHLISLQNV